MESDGSTLTITGATALTPTIGATAWANATHAHAADNSGSVLALGTATSGNYVATVANATNGGTTIANSGSEPAAVTVALNFTDLTAAAVNVAADSIPFLDADGTASRLESIADLATAMAGTNLTASSGQLVASAGGTSTEFVIAMS